MPLPSAQEGCKAPSQEIAELANWWDVAGEGSSLRPGQLLNSSPPAPDAGTLLQKPICIPWAPAESPEWFWDENSKAFGLESHNTCSSRQIIAQVLLLELAL